MTSSARSLWMGDLEPSMDEAFIQTAFGNLGFTVLNVKRILNKHTGGFAGYCFVEFDDAQTADRALSSVNGGVIPGLSPQRRFRLSHAMHSKDAAEMGPEHSLFVGDLTSDVTDAALFQYVKMRYPSVRSAKVVLDQSGNSRGYGFIRFMDEAEYKKALSELSGASGCGSKPLRVNPATPKQNHHGGSRPPFMAGGPQFFGQPVSYYSTYPAPYGQPQQGGGFSPVYTAPMQWGYYPGYEPTSPTMSAFPPPQVSGGPYGNPQPGSYVAYAPANIPSGPPHYAQHGFMKK